MKKRTSRREKGITLIALIVTIIVLLILAGVTINLALNNQGVLEKAKIATREYQNAATNEEKNLEELGNIIGKYIKKEGIGTGTTIAKDSYPTIIVTGLIYADLDGDTSTAEGLVVSTSKGDAVVATTKMPEGYTMSNYEGESKTAAGKIITTNITGRENFYVLALADYDTNEHYWYKNAYENLDNYFTSTAFGQGKNNTLKMIERIKDHGDMTKYKYDSGDPITARDDTNPYGPDMWYLIKDETNWFVPSKEEWWTFLANLEESGLSVTKYSNYGLRASYWSSSQDYMINAWTVAFNQRKICADYTKFSNYIRLCTTF